MGAEIDQAGADDLAACINTFIADKSSWCLAQCQDFSIRNVQVSNLINSTGRIYDTAPSIIIFIVWGSLSLGAWLVIFQLTTHGHRHNGHAHGNAVGDLIQNN